jgi:hypothetical protein
MNMHIASTGDDVQSGVAIYGQAHPMVALFFLLPACLVAYLAAP